MKSKLASGYSLVALLSLFFVLAFSQSSLADSDVLQELRFSSSIDIEVEGWSIAFALGLSLLKKESQCQSYSSMVVVPGQTENETELVLTIGLIGEIYNCWISIGYRHSWEESSNEPTFDLLWVTPVNVEAPRAGLDGLKSPVNH